MQSNNLPKIYIIVGTTRANRFSEKAAAWIFHEAQKRTDISVELIDLKDYPLPFFEEPISPGMSKGQYPNPVVKKWADKIAKADGFIIVTAEYNHGYPAVLKNALDYIYYEWNKKAVGFVAYGSVGGARAVEQLREVAVELQMASIRTGIHIPFHTVMAVNNQNDQDPKTSEHFKLLNDRKDTFLDELVWWTNALKEARNKNK